MNTYFLIIKCLKSLRSQAFLRFHTLRDLIVSGNVIIKMEQHKKAIC